MFRYQHALTGLLCLAAPTLAPAHGNHHEPLKPDRVLLTLNGDPARQMAVTWRTDEPTSGVAQYTVAKDGPHLEKGANTVTATVSDAIETTPGERAYYQTVTLSNLKPSTKYAYRVGDGKQHWSEWNHFDTASDKRDPFSFIYVGDAQVNVLSLWARVIRDAFRAQADARFILHAGDLINSANNDDQWAEWFEAAGWINRVIPVLAVPGNHEHYVPKGSKDRQLSHLWRPQFEFPKNGLPTHRDTNYFIDYQGVRIVAMNSSKDHDEQGVWLDKVLSDNPNRWTILTFHHPVYSAAVRRDNPELREAWLGVIEKHKVDLVLQGHDHTYGRSQQIKSGEQVKGEVAQQGEGSVYVVSVSGPKMYDLTETNDDLMARVAEDTQLYQLIHIDGDTLKYEAYTAAGSLYDAFHLKKLSNGRSKLENRIPARDENRRAKKKKNR
jgi:hypothetical protein